MMDYNVQGMNLIHLRHAMFRYSMSWFKLQFMMDYNVQGMNLIHLRHAMFRYSKRVGSSCSS